MGATKCKPREVVVEVADRDLLPRGFVVTREARLAEAALVLIAMTRRASGGEPKIRGCAARVRLGVTLRAGRLRVRAVQDPPGQRMIEPRSISVRPTQEGFGPEMFCVTLLARLALVLSAMKTRARRDAGPKIAVTLETCIGIHPFAAAVAIVAMRIALERLVRLRQGTRR